MEDRTSVLIVDDTPHKLLAYSALLSELGHEVVTAGSGREALRQLLRREFAVVLLDVRMPEMDGFETAAMMRRRKRSELTPILFITSYPEEEFAAQGYSLGAVDFISAPIQPQILKAKISVFAELYRKTAKIREQSESLARRAMQLQKLTEASLAINSALSVDRILEVVAEIAREIFDSRQAAIVAAPDLKWSETRSAVAIASEFAREGERRVFRDRPAMLEVLARLRQTIQTDPVRGVETRLTKIAGFEPPPDGAWLAAPLTGRDGLIMGLLHVFHRKDAEFSADDAAIATQLAQMASIAIENGLNAQAREANRVKDEFLTTLSHELRTPLSAILGWTRTIRSGRLEADQVSHGLEVIERNVVAQTRLIDDLLDVSRIITGRLRLSVAPTRLPPIVQAAIESMRPAAEAKEIDVSLLNRLDEGSDAIVGDGDRVQQIIWNLVSNAIKFTPPHGCVRVEISRDQGQYEIRVTDTGKGIAAEFLGHIFERFRQADSSRTRTQGGLGIGLAIARHLVELHGGSISVESSGVGLGATFRVRLPVAAIGVLGEEAQALPGPAADSPVEANLEDLAGLKVLIVEDHDDGRELLVEALRACRATVAWARSAAEALAVFEAIRPDVVVSDIGMPGQDGLSLLGQIRERFTGGRSVRAIAVSAYARDEDRNRCLEAGFQAHIAKPFDPAELSRVLARVARSEGLLRSRETGGSRVPDSPEEARGPDLPRRDEGAGLPVLVVEDDGDAREGLRLLLESWGFRVEEARDGASAIASATARPPHVAIIDVGLPDMEGYDLARRLRTVLGETRTVLIALTGYVGVEDRRRAFDSGFDAFLSKPVDVPKLRTLLNLEPPPPAPLARRGNFAPLE